MDIDVLQDPRDKLNDDMRSAVARAFGDEHFRAYITLCAQDANQKMINAMDNGKTEQAQLLARKFKVLTNLLSVGRQYFIHYNKLTSNKTLEDNTNTNESQK